MTSCWKFCVVASITNEAVVVVSLIESGFPKEFPYPRTCSIISRIGSSTTRALVWVGGPDWRVPALFTGLALTYARTIETVRNGVARSTSHHAGRAETGYD